MKTPDGENMRTTFEGVLPEVHTVLERVLYDDAWSDCYNTDHRLLELVVALGREVVRLRREVDALKGDTDASNSASDT